ncbi:hypothetical protein BpHYR1_007322, partial [Brachionus plicatilis]
SRKEIRIVSQKEIKFLDIVKQKWGLNQNTLGNLYKSFVGSILDYYFPWLNSFSENNIKKLQAIQNTAVRSILKLKNLMMHDVGERALARYRKQINNNIFRKRLMPSLQAII